MYWLTTREGTHTLFVDELCSSTCYRGPAGSVSRVPCTRVPTTGCLAHQGGLIVFAVKADNLVRCRSPLPLRLPFHTHSPTHLVPKTADLEGIFSICRLELFSGILIVKIMNNDFRNREFIFVQNDLKALKG